MAEEGSRDTVESAAPTREQRARNFTNEFSGQAKVSGRYYVANTPTGRQVVPCPKESWVASYSSEETSPRAARAVRLRRALSASRVACSRALEERLCRRLIVAGIIVGGKGIAFSRIPPPSVFFHEGSRNCQCPRRNGCIVAVFKPVSRDLQVISAIPKSWRLDV